MYLTTTGGSAGVDGRLGNLWSSHHGQAAVSSLRFQYSPLPPTFISKSPCTCIYSIRHLTTSCSESGIVRLMEIFAAACGPFFFFLLTCSILSSHFQFSWFLPFLICQRLQLHLAFWSAFSGLRQQYLSIFMVNLVSAFK